MALFTNQATLSYNGNVVDSNIVTGELIEALTATKTALVDTYDVDGTITYIVSLINSGNTPLTGITLSDDLGAYAVGETVTAVPLSYIDGTIRYYANGILQATPTVVAGPPMTVVGITVPANGNALVIYETNTTLFTPFATGSAVTNTVTATGAALAEAVSASETVTVADAANLTITKALSPQTVLDNDRLTYTFTIQNTGNTALTAEDAAIISDTFNPILSDLTVTFNGTVLPATAYTYNAATGQFTTVSGQITVPAATYNVNETTGAVTVIPGVSVLTVTGTV